MAIHGLIFLDDWSFDCTTHLLLLMVQKALVSMDESGTGAVEATVDRPFVFLIRDIETGLSCSWGASWTQADESCNDGRLSFLAGCDRIVL